MRPRRAAAPRREATQTCDFNPDSGGDEGKKSFEINLKLFLKRCFSGVSAEIHVTITFTVLVIFSVLLKRVGICKALDKSDLEIKSRKIQYPDFFFVINVCLRAQ